MPQVNDFSWLTIFIQVFSIFLVFISYLHYFCFSFCFRKNIFSNLIFIII